VKQSLDDENETGGIFQIGATRMKYLILFLILFALPVARAKDIYITQRGAGWQSGENVANAHSIAWLDTAANWGAGAGKVSAGDTVRLSGTFSTMFNIRGNGTAGNVITIFFEPNAKFSAPFWAGGAIQGGSVSYVTIDGGTNGLIESTANGTALANKVESYGVWVTSSASNFTVQNLKIDNMYVRTAYSTDGIEAGAPIVILDIGDNVTIKNCVLRYGATLLGISWGAGTRSNLKIQNNTLTRANHALTIGCTTDNAVLDGVEISGNRFDEFSFWRGNSGFHLDAMILFFESPGSTENLRNARIFNNKIGPDIGGPPIGGVSAHNTAGIFINHYNANQFTGAQIYNNLFRANPNDKANRHLKPTRI
jgi:hypothetical protein